MWQRCGKNHLLARSRDIYRGHASESKIVDAILPIQKAQELAVDGIGTMKNVKLSVTVLKDGRVYALLGMYKLER
jgi:hypothetical protein